jgi:putative transposase
MIIHRLTQISAGPGKEEVGADLLIGPSEVIMDTQYPRRKRLRLEGHDYGEPGWAYFLTVRARPETAPFRDRALAEAATATLLNLQSLTGVQLLAYCVMPDHVHAVCWTPNGSASIPSFMRRFKSFVSGLARGSGHSGGLWQRSYHDHIVRRSEDLSEVCAYVVENPVRKGLVAEAADYPFARFLGLP